MTNTVPHMHQALGLAAQALFLSSPNPRVGCVLVAPDGRVVGQGFTQQAGGPHAEVMALRDAVDRKSTRLNSSHLVISYAVFCLKKKKKKSRTSIKHY